jgi:hypothetical protein
MNPNQDQNTNLKGLFRIEIDADGKAVADFTTITAQIELCLRWSLLTDEDKLVRSLLLLSIGSTAFRPIQIPEPKIQPMGHSNVLAVSRAARSQKKIAELIEKTVLTPLRESLGKEIGILVDSTNSKKRRNAARKALSAKLNHALDALEKKQDRQPHGNASVIDCRFEGGLIRSMPAAWVALHVAKEMVEKNRSLPSKGLLRLQLYQQYPDTLKISNRKWALLWKEAGLQDLPRSASWELEELKRAAAKRKRTKK